MGDTLYDTLGQLPAGTLKSLTGINQDTTTDTILNGKSKAFSTAYTALDEVGNNYQVAQFYNQQTQRLSGVLTDLAQKGQTNTGIANQNIALNTRNAEIKEWYFNNKLDTLFVFQLLFLSLCLLAFLAYLMKLGFFGTGFFGMLVGLLIIILILVIANRAVYTEKVRDKRYWSKRGFSSVGDALPGVNKKCN